VAVLPKALQKLIDELGKLPGVGPRTAERYAYSLLKRSPQISKDIASALESLHNEVKQCPKTFALIEKDQKVSPLYDGAERDRQQVAVVEEPLDVVAIEKTAQYKGTYHVLGGTLSPIDGVGPEQLKIKELLSRIKDDKVKEVILATNASVEGESTALFIQKHIKDKGVKISRLARGLPVGVDLEYADQITIGQALEGRQLL
jgi:recombination protein RecR